MGDLYSGERPGIDRNKTEKSAKKRMITAAMVAAAMMSAQAAQAGYVEAQSTTTQGAPPPNPTPNPAPPPLPVPPPPFDNKKECKQFFKQDGKLTKKEKKKCNKMFD